MVTFASSSEPNSRPRVFFINKKDANTYLDQYKLPVRSGGRGDGEVVDQITRIRRATHPRRIAGPGRVTISRNYPRMDKIVKASIIAVVEP